MNLDSLRKALALDIDKLITDYSKENEMPLLKGAKAKTKKGFSSNVKKEMEAGKKQSQAVAIAYAQSRKAKKNKKK